MRTALFLGYMFLLSRVRDLRRVFEYHGAEHKTISCFEAGLPLTPANAQRFSRLHPRCGTSFLLVVMIVAIFVFAPIGLPAWYWLVATRILGVPLIAGISFELIKFAGRNRSRRWVRAVMWPGLKLQLLTTREPDLDQLEVAIAALQAVLALRDARRALGRRPASASRSSPRAQPAGGAPPGTIRPTSSRQPSFRRSSRISRALAEVQEEVDAEPGEQRLGEILGVADRVRLAQQQRHVQAVDGVRGRAEARPARPRPRRAPRRGRRAGRCARRPKAISRSRRRGAGAERRLRRG